MRPHNVSLPCTARLRTSAAVQQVPRSVSGARQYARTTEILSTNSICPGSRRPSSAWLPGQSLFQEQKRWITQNYLRRVAEAKEEWAGFAKEIKEGKRKSFLEHLEERELVKDTVGDRDFVNRIFTEKRVGMYVGVDPTGPSLHVGHMLPFMVLAWGFNWGMPVYFLLGGSTARVGDPTGRTEGRKQVHSSVRKANMASMHMQIKKLSAGIERYGARYGYKRQYIWKRALENNNTWWNKQPFMEVLRDLGAYMRLGPMLGRDNVKTRLAGDGMSFAEFSYPLLQAWDWWILFRRNKVQVQIGGSDQYGNILFGMDAVKSISRNCADQEYRNPLENDIDKPVGLTTPLLTTASGAKFGKSAGNAVWLDKDMTSTFELYQFFVRTPDNEVERYLKMFTFKPLPEIAKIMEEQSKDPSKRVAQHALASEFVELIHGPAEAQAVAQQHRQLFKARNTITEPTPMPRTPSVPSGPPKPTDAFINQASGNVHAVALNHMTMPSANVTLPRSLVYNVPFSKILWHAGMVASKGEGARLIANKGANVGSRPGIKGSLKGGDMPDALAYTNIHSWPGSRTEEFIIGGNLLILKIGKWKLKLVNIVSDEEYKELGLTAPGWDAEAGKPAEEVEKSKGRKEIDDGVERAESKKKESTESSESVSA
ncbi:hypothetical protein BJY04DRAFT_180001 [Aspergillus karnatakaensis]|uniref:tyrosine--tRNA ligase MSY1 n=1 Tax=Aspergillus karnatakaensis TaxID=1810916 RepID=UPI003CCD38B9